MKRSYMLVKLAINNVLRDVYKEKFIYDSYACIKGKGTHKCAERIQSYMKRAQWEYGAGATVIKADVQKLMSKHKILSGTIARKLKIAPKYMDEFFNGLRYPTAETQERIMKALDDLIVGKGQ